MQKKKQTFLMQKSIQISFSYFKVARDSNYYSCTLYMCNSINTHERLAVTMERQKKEKTHTHNQLCDAHINPFIHLPVTKWL